jgi:hypothetical protein
VSITLAPKEAPAAVGSDLGLNHIYCCSPDVSLCGLDISQHPEIDVDENMCVVCEDLEDGPCTCTEASF